MAVAVTLDSKVWSPVINHQDIVPGNLIEKDNRKAITKQMGKISKKKGEIEISDEYKAFLALNYENIVQGLDVATIKKNYNQLKQ